MISPVVASRENTLYKVLTIKCGFPEDYFSEETALKLANVTIPMSMWEALPDNLLLGEPPPPCPEYTPCDIIDQ